VPNSCLGLDLRNIYAVLREKYRPVKVDVLFIGESPPFPKDPSVVPYFYNAEEDQPRRLYRRIASALDLRKPKAEGLEDLRRRKLWLTDIFDEPIKNVKIEDVEMHLDRLLHEIEEANPRKIIALLPKRVQNQIFLYFLKHRVSPDIKVFHINPWAESKEKLKNFLSEVLDRNGGSFG